MEARTYHTMAELLSQKVQALIAMMTMIVSWIIAQGSIVEQGFDQLFSLGLLIVAIIVVWKAFNKKDESESQLLRDQIQAKDDLIKIQKNIIDGYKQKRD